MPSRWCRDWGPLRHETHVKSQEIIGFGKSRGTVLLTMQNILGTVFPSLWQPQLHGRAIEKNGQRVVGMHILLHSFADLGGNSNRGPTIAAIRVTCFTWPSVLIKKPQLFEPTSPRPRPFLRPWNKNKILRRFGYYDWELRSAFGVVEG